MFDIKMNCGAENGACATQIHSVYQRYNNCKPLENHLWKNFADLAELKSIFDEIGLVINDVNSVELAESDIRQLLPSLVSLSERMDASIKSVNGLPFYVLFFAARKVRSLEAIADRTAGLVETLELSLNPDFYSYIGAVLQEGSAANSR